MLSDDDDGDDDDDDTTEGRVGFRDLEVSDRGTGHL